MPDAREGAETLRARLDHAHKAADRLVREAEAAARRVAGDVPPSGWEPPPGEPAPPDFEAIGALLEALRRVVPPELSRQLAEAVRDLLLALRALIDWYLERLGQPERSEPPAVEEIPLD